MRSRQDSSIYPSGGRVSLTTEPYRSRRGKSSRYSPARSSRSSGNNSSNTYPSGGRVSITTEPHRHWPRQSQWQRQGSQQFS